MDVLLKSLGIAAVGVTGYYMGCYKTRMRMLKTIEEVKDEIKTDFENWILEQMEQD